MKEATTQFSTAISLKRCWMRISDTPKISSSPDIACSLTKRSSKSLQKTSILLRLLNWKSANRSRLQSVPDSTFQPAGFSSECRLSATLALKRFGLGRNRKWNWAHVSSQRHQVFMFFTFTAPASDGINPRSIPWTDGCPLPDLRLISHSSCPLNTFIKNRFSHASVKFPRHSPSHPTGVLANPGPGYGCKTSQAG
jgi:hypothetical protein